MKKWPFKKHVKRLSPEVEGVEDSTFKQKLIEMLVSSVRNISKESDRDEVIKWFIQARDISNQDVPKSQIAKELYQSIDTKAVVKILWNSICTSFSRYKDSNLPLSIKVALPATIAGTTIVGAHGAGIVAFGGGIGLPVVLLLFLGTAGLTSIVEAFIKDETVRDPLTKALLSIAALEAKRRFKKEFIRALREEVTIPKKVIVPSGDKELIESLRTMDPFAFERHTMSFFMQKGYPVGVTPRTNDFGVDGWIQHPDGLIIVQCKRNSEENKVGRPDVQQFKGVIEEQGAMKGYLITTSHFTDEAQKSAEKNKKIILVDIDQLVSWHKEDEKQTA